MADWAPDAWVGKLCRRIRCQPCHVYKVERHDDANPAACLAAGLVAYKYGVEFALAPLHMGTSPEETIKVDVHGSVL